eukprot:2844579-Pleurochrysis_carterae.AAC.1
MQRRRFSLFVPRRILFKNQLSGTIPDVGALTGLVQLCAAPPLEDAVWRCLTLYRGSVVAAGHVLITYRPLNDLHLLLMGHCAIAVKPTEGALELE